MRKTLTFREWLSKLLGIGGDMKQQRQDRQRARAMLLAAIDDLAQLQRGSNEKHH